MKDKIEYLFYWIISMMPVFLVSLLILAMQVIFCYWMYKIHWSVGLFVGCGILAMDIYAWDNSKY